jgi:hypothetical protein
VLVYHSCGIDPQNDFVGSSTLSLSYGDINDNNSLRPLLTSPRVNFAETNMSPVFRAEVVW